MTAVHSRLFYSLCYLPSQTEVRHDSEKCNLIKSAFYQNKNFLSGSRAKPTLQLFPFSFQRDEWWAQTWSFLNQDTIRWPVCTSKYNTTLSWGAAALEVNWKHPLRACSAKIWSIHHLADACTDLSNSDYPLCRDTRTHPRELVCFTPRENLSQDILGSRWLSGTSWHPFIPGLGLCYPQQYCYCGNLNSSYCYNIFRQRARANLAIEKKILCHTQAVFLKYTSLKILLYYSQSISSIYSPCCFLRLVQMRSLSTEITSINV